MRNESVLSRSQLVDELGDVHVDTMSVSATAVKALAFL